MFPSHDPTGSHDGDANVYSILRKGTYGDEESLDMTVNGLGRVFRGDPELVSGTTTYAIVEGDIAAYTARGFQSGAAAPLIDLVISASDGAGGISSTRTGATTAGTRITSGFQMRRLTQWSGSYSPTGKVLFVAVSLDGTVTADTLEDNLTDGSNASGTLFFPIDDSFVAAGAPFGAIAGSTLNGGWGLENNPRIP